MEHASCTRWSPTAQVTCNCGTLWQSDPTQWRTQRSSAFFWHDRLRRTNVCSPLLISVSVYAGHQTEGFRKLCPLGSSVIERWYVAPGVKRVSVQERGVRGTLFIPPGEFFLSASLFLALHVFAGFKGLSLTPVPLSPGPGPFPGVLDMWGGGGGLVEYRSALLASHGYVSLALEYLSAEEIVSASEEVHYFEVRVGWCLRIHSNSNVMLNWLHPAESCRIKPLQRRPQLLFLISWLKKLLIFQFGSSALTQTAFSFLQEHPQVVPDRVGLFGLSLGCIITLYLAAESSVVKVTGCAGWT